MIADLLTGANEGGSIVDDYEERSV